jgi:catechol 2,3-dioxygenase-like lactoylglutathione lyase family enzyme
MPELRLHHVAVALRAIEPALRLYRDALGGRDLGGGEESGTGDGGWVWRQVGFPGGGRVELLEPRGPGFLNRFLDSHGEGLHHLTFRTDDIRAAIDDVRRSGYELVDVDLNDPDWREAFLRPSGAHGTLIQVAESSG